MTNRFDAAAAQWDADTQRVRMAESIAKAMSQALSLKKNQVLMDYGTGTGLIAFALQPRVARVVAVDTSAGMLAVVQEKSRRLGLQEVIQPCQWSWDQDPAVIPPLDVIVSSMTLHHVQEIAAAARVFYARLKPQGQIAIADLDSEDGTFHSDARSVVHTGFDRAEFQAAFESAGFVEVRLQTIYTAIRPAATGGEKAFPIFLMTGYKN